LGTVYARGAFKDVYLGTYTSGDRKGESCVHKFFRDRAVFEDEYFAADVKVVQKAIQIVSAWNDLGVINKDILVNEATVWVVQNGERVDQKCLVEPHIIDFEKFNSNSGWVAGDLPWQDVMQALSHFSYHSTGGNFVLCDLQGGVYKNAAVISDPVILSRRVGAYGPTDLGPDGISNFFHHHVCTSYCKSHWSQPRVQNHCFDPTAGTSMAVVQKGKLTLYNKSTLKY